MSKNSYKPIKPVITDHKVILKQIGESIENIRRAKGVSVTELCNNVGMSRTTYYRLKDGLIYFNTEKFFKILDVLEAKLTVSIEK